MRRCCACWITSMSAACPTWAIAVRRRFAAAAPHTVNPVNDATARATLHQEAAERDDWLDAGVQVVNGLVQAVDAGAVLASFCDQCGR